MKQIAIISGKGGTGKTSLTAAFGFLAQNAVMADCDVDAADLHLVASPVIERRMEFKSGKEAVIRQADCTHCGGCLAHCRFEAIRMNGREAGEAEFFVDPIYCEGCGVCVRMCPAEAIDFPERTCGEWFISRTRLGPMVHARLGIAAENSGKLVSVVRRQASELAAQTGRDTVLIDGPPGIGCAVIASIAGTNFVLIVTEPTLSGEHDMERVLLLSKHFNIPAGIILNKWDLNPEAVERLEEKALLMGATTIARIRYDPVMVAAQLEGKTVVEMPNSDTAKEVRNAWERLCRIAA